MNRYASFLSVSPNALKWSKSIQIFIHVYQIIANNNSAFESCRQHRFRHSIEHNFVGMCCVFCSVGSFIVFGRHRIYVFENYKKHFVSFPFVRDITETVLQSARRPLAHHVIASQVMCAILKHMKKTQFGTCYPKKKNETSWMSMICAYENHQPSRMNCACLCMSTYRWNKVSAAGYLPIAILPWSHTIQQQQQHTYTKSNEDTEMKTE